MKLFNEIKVWLIKIKWGTIHFVWYFRRKLVKPKLPVNVDGKVYVNLGCGRHTSKEYINIDTAYLPNIHYLTDVTDLYMLADNSVDLLYASHVLEHIPRTKLLKTLKDWYRVLKPGGKLRFGVPDFDKLIEVYKLSNRDVNSIVNQLMGAVGECDDHHTPFIF